jgi:hypothetical protein
MSNRAIVLVADAQPRMRLFPRRSRELHGFGRHAVAADEPLETCLTRQLDLTMLGGQLSSAEAAMVAPQPRDNEGFVGGPQDGRPSRRSSSPRGSAVRIEASDGR